MDYESDVKKVLEHYKGQQFFGRSYKWYSDIYKLSKNGYVCGLCKREIERINQLSIDHIIPSSFGGGNSIKNKQLSHIACNSLKGYKQNLPPSYFIKNTKPNGDRISKKSKLKKKDVIVKNIELKSESNNWATELWNEIAINQFKNLSYNKFEQYFKNYANAK
jgi:5-methylcytosine-specific restriction endonuclease McrA